MQVNHLLILKDQAIETIAPDATIAEASRRLAEHKIGAVLVLGADRRIVGILSERDIVRGLDRSGAALLNMRVSELMTRNVVSCAPDDTVEEIMQEMTTRRIRHLPVLAQGRLVGIVSIGDVVKSRLEELTSESEALRSYIAGA
jgi:CBS domain-containing protein